MTATEKKSTGGALYIVATPIGNLEDITLRALRVLKEVDLIFCEDTRITKRLLDRYRISTFAENLNARTEMVKIKRIGSLLSNGKNLALVSDAGTPAISDPGAILISEIRRIMPNVSIIPIPGPSALSAALSVSGLPSSDFLFLGFLPHKKGRQKLFREISESKRTVVFYESPHRIIKALESLSDFVPEKQMIVFREMTKIHEEIIKGTVKDLLEFFKKNQEKVRGEFVVAVSS